jgi:hypothetical protein
MERIADSGLTHLALSQIFRQGFAGRRAKRVRTSYLQIPPRLAASEKALAWADNGSLPDGWRRRAASRLTPLRARGVSLFALLYDRQRGLRAEFQDQPNREALASSVW